MTLFFIIFNFLDVLIGRSVLFTNSVVGFEILVLVNCTINVMNILHVPENNVYLLHC